MDLQGVVLLIGALGGFEAIKWGLNAFVHRKANARKEDASAEEMEINNLRSVIESLTHQLENSEKRSKERDTKVDFLYAELRREQSEKLDLIKEKHVLELSQKEAEMKRCTVRGCKDRMPPSEY